MPSLHPSWKEAPARPATAPLKLSRDRDRQLVALVEAARSGDAEAWTRLVHRFDRVLRHIARSYRLAPADVDEVVQTTWLELVEAIQRIREPEAIGGWLATVTRRNALRRRQMHVREELTDDPQLADRTASDGSETSVLAAERRANLAAALARALAALPDRHQQLLTVLLTQPTLDYRQVGELVGMPVGSIGPIRARALARLARDAELRAIND